MFFLCCVSKGIKFSDADFLKMLINLIGKGPVFCPHDVAKGQRA